jgi:hypothetical protein
VPIHRMMDVLAHDPFAHDVGCHGQLIGCLERVGGAQRDNMSTNVSTASGTAPAPSQSNVQWLTREL